MLANFLKQLHRLLVKKIRTKLHKKLKLITVSAITNSRTNTIPKIYFEFSVNVYTVHLRVSSSMF